MTTPNHKQILQMADDFKLIRRIDILEVYRQRDLSNPSKSLSKTLSLMIKNKSIKRVRKGLYKVL